MRVEIPECKRCCVCIPLRFGILTFSYLCLILNLLVFSADIYFYVIETQDHLRIAVLRGVGVVVQGWLCVIINSLDIISSIILVVGAHKKHVLLLKTYYYYDITTCLASFVIYVTVRDYGYPWAFYIAEFSYVFFALGVHLYLLLLIRSELRKIKNARGFSFINHQAEVRAPPETQFVNVF